MYFTEPKFHEISLESARDLLQQIKSLEFQTNLQSPRTQKALDSLGILKDRFRRRNKFEFGDHALFIEYLKELLISYRNLRQERKKIIKELRERQIKEGILKEDTINFTQDGLDYNNPPTFVPPTIDDKLLKIEKEREREKLIQDNLTKQAIIQELERRRLDEALKTREDKSKKTREIEILKRQAKSQQINKKIAKVQQEHKNSLSEQLQQDFLKSQTFPTKFQKNEQKHSEYLQKHQEKIIMINERLMRRFLEKRNSISEKETKRLDQKLTDEQEKEELRQKTADTMVTKNKLRSTDFDIIKKQQLEEQTQQEQCNLYAKKLDQMKQWVILRDKQIEKMQTDMKKRIDQRFKKQKSLISLQKEELQKQIQETDERRKEKERKAEELRQQKLKEIVIQNRQRRDLEQSNHQHLYNEAIKDQYEKQHKLLEKSTKVTDNLQRTKEDQFYLLRYSTMSKRKMDIYQQEQLKELDSFKIASQEQLIQKFQSLIQDEKDKDVLEDLKKKFLPKEVVPIKMSESQQMFNKVK
ncbi:hypothetical protein pb186bvf_004859 [Paramecium bursaria]